MTSCSGEKLFCSKYSIFRITNKQRERMKRGRINISFDNLSHTKSSSKAVCGEQVAVLDQPSTYGRNNHFSPNALAFISLLQFFGNLQTQSTQAWMEGKMKTWQIQEQMCKLNLPLKNIKMCIDRLKLFSSI